MMLCAATNFNDPALNDVRITATWEVPITLVIIIGDGI
jgi:hypothetical protein